MENEALRLIRVFHNLNRTQTADKVGLSVSYVSELESGTKKVTLEVLQKYATGFRMPVSSIMLFAERADEGSLTEAARLTIGGKVVKMLNWLAAISSEDDQAVEGSADARIGRVA
jgi:transcriptional regulator with XRE-family HTH domain